MCDLDMCDHYPIDDSAHYMTEQQIKELKALKAGNHDRIVFGVIRPDGSFVTATAFNLNEVRDRVTTEDQVFEAYIADHKGKVRLKEIAPHFDYGGRLRN